MLMPNEWCLRKIWIYKNEKSKLGHLVYEIASLCFKCLHDKFYKIKLKKLGYGLSLNETCMVMRFISHRTCTNHMPKFRVMRDILF